MWKTFAHIHKHRETLSSPRAYSFAASLHNWQTTLNINVFMQLHSEMFIRAYYAREIIMKRTIIVISLCVFCVWMLAISSPSPYISAACIHHLCSVRWRESYWTTNNLQYNALLRVANYYHYCYYRHRSKCKTTNLNWDCNVLKRISTQYRYTWTYIARFSRANYQIMYSTYNTQRKKDK